MFTFTAGAEIAEEKSFLIWWQEAAQSKVSAFQAYHGRRPEGSGESASHADSPEKQSFLGDLCASNESHFNAASGR